MKRIKLLSLSLVLVIVSILVSLAPVAAQDTLLIWADAERAPLLLELGADFEAQFGVKVEVQEMGLGDARDQLLVAGPVGEGPDLMIVAHDTLGQLVVNSAIVPIELGELEANFVPLGIELFTYDGQLWALPYNLENVALIRNVDLVPEAPTTWQEVRAISEQLVADGKLYGFVAHTGNPYHVFPIFSAFGGYVFGSDDGGLTLNVQDIGLNSEGGLAAATWLSEMYLADLMPQNIGDNEVFDLFETGDAAMFITGPWFSQRIAETAEAGGFTYAIDPLPGAEGISEVGAPFKGGQGFVISAFSDQKLNAETFLFDFVATLDVMQRLTSRLPAFVGVVNPDPNMAFFEAAGAVTVPMPTIPEMGSVWAGWGNNLTLISQDADPVESMNNAVQQIQDAIALRASTSKVVVIAGNLQDEAGCPGEWDPGCTVTQMVDSGNGIYTFAVTLPAGEYEYKIALGGGWDENYGANGEPGGANILLSVPEEMEVMFSYNDETKAIADSINNPDALEAGMGMSDVVVVAGTVQSKVGCPGDWDPACTLSQLTFVGDGIYEATFTLPAGEYEYKVALNGGWDVNFGAACAAGGDNIALSLAEETAVTFTFDQNIGLVSDSVNQQTDC
ncbi:MAG: extracellular solute-binding protein [Anaerolineae bacterium]|jgi:maltose/maltodextrin transport system substrate-binding protein/arabinogalactan oligomer/maltooligosaccharide transport system substrate-binding protein|nr:extracellular solute-binding protein [Anaerolineae bacterium]